MPEPLRLGVDPRPAEEGFGRYEAAADRATAATNRAAQSIDVYERAMADRLTSADIAAAEQQYAQMFDEVSEKTDEATSSASRATGGFARLNYSLASVARQATGVHPAIGQLASTVSTFALGSATTVAVLGGLAAIATAIRLIGREGREAEERLRAAREELDKLAPDTGVGEALAVVQARYNENLARYNALGTDEDIRRRLIANPNIGLQGARDRAAREREELFQQLMQDAERLARGQGAFGEQHQQELVQRARALQEQIGFAMADADRRITQQILDDRRQAELAYQAEIGGQIRAGAAANLTAPPRFSVEGGAFQKAAEEQQLVITERRIEAEQQLAQLERDRLRAHIALVRSLENVGRAYGGVVDQILALISASLALSRMPMESFGDRATAYATAGLTGIGYGASTGNALLGALGGGASGFAVAGPAGAVVGAVSGIVSGLIEHGRRAEEAARIWRRSLEDFSLMFDQLTPAEQNIEALNRQFEQLSDGRTRQEAEAYLELLRSFSDPNSPFFDPQRAAKVQLQVARYEELLAIYDENAAQARELADAERDLYQSRTAALNAPEGLRLALFEWRAAGASRLDPFAPPGTENAPNGPTIIQGDVVFQIPGASDPESVADAVMVRLHHQALRGGPDPLVLTRR